MKIKDKNELKGMTELILDIPEEELKKYENRAALATNSSMIQLFNIPLNKVTKELIRENLKNTALLQMGTRAQEFVKNEVIDDSDDFTFISNLVVPTPSDEDELSVTVYTKPTIKFNYKNLDKPEPFEGLYDDEKELLLDTELKKLQKNNARLNPVDRAFEDGDAVSITEKEDGNEETNVYFSDQLEAKPTLKANLIGKSVGDSFSYEPFENVNVTVNQVYELDLDDIDDEFASEVSEFDTLEELKNSIIENEEKKLRDQYQNETKNKLLLQFLNGIEISDVDESLIEYIKNPAALDESDVSAFMDGFYTSDDSKDYKSIEYYNHVLEFIFDQILKDEGIEPEPIVEEIIENWDSGDYDDKFKAALSKISNDRVNLSEENFRSTVDSIVKSNLAQDIIFNYTLDSEN